MSKFIQNPHKLDSNVTINVPESIEVNYDYKEGKWYIVIDKIQLPEIYESSYDAVDWLIEKGLIKTKAYATLDAKIKKAQPKTKKAKADK